MNIALVFPPSTFLTSPMVWMPLGPMYIASQLQALGHNVDYFDLSEDELPMDGEYDQVWFSSTAPQMGAIRQIAEITKYWNNTKTVLGGSAVWADPYRYAELPINMFVVGEGDHPETIDYIVKNAGNSWQELYFPNLSANLNWVLPPERRWSYRYVANITGQNGIDYNFSSMFTTRGCSMNCSFCESGRSGVIWGNKVRYEPMWSVEYQIKEISDLGYDGLTNYDDIAILNKRRTLEMLELYKQYGLVWRGFMRSDILCKHGGKDYLREMQDGGLIEIFLGVESANNHIKENIRKGTTIEQDEAVVRWCQELGITCKCSFILGLPGETFESMLATQNWILRVRPHIVQIDRLIPFPGVPLTKYPEDYDLVYEEMPDEEYFFKGRWDINSKSFVSTSHLTRDEIDIFWHNLEEILLLENLSGYNH